MPSERFQTASACCTIMAYSFKSILFAACCACAQALGDFGQLDKFAAQAVGVGLIGLPGEADDVVPAHFAVVLAAAQLLAVGGYGNGKAGVGIGLRQGFAVGGHGLADKDAGAFAGQFVAQVHMGVFTGFAVGGRRGGPVA